ncbi:unnamed protein product [Enterobius vermicularis]|uniref:AMP-binding domain-containing protein n=1 Tax=Enterobius vermicularis TaxID=51028 RepID=A0A0N4V3U5_ENTVE|nr:unnamed protein product [Enterobius vermicularis]
MSKPIECTIPELVEKCANIDRIAAIFDSEKETYTFGKIYNEVNSFAAGLLSSGLEAKDRILICGSNCAQLFISALACARASLLFSLMNPNFTSSQQLQYALFTGEYKAIICFSANKENELLHNLLIEIAPELRTSAKGHVNSKALPKLTHVIMAEEEHKHAGTFTLSEIYGRSNRERLEKLHKITNGNPHEIAALQFTTGVSGEPKLVALSHYQLINGCQSAAEGIGIRKEAVIYRKILLDTFSCALPMFKIAVFSLVGLLPFVVGTRVIFPSPSPLPKFLFNSVNTYQCTHLLTNAVALRLIMKIVVAQKVQLPSITTVILAGERVPAELLENIGTHLRSVKNIVSTYMLTETASMPIMTNDNSLLTTTIGSPLPMFQIEIAPCGIAETSNEEPVGVLRIKPVNGSKFIGYGPNFDQNSEWIDTGDVVKLNRSGAISLIANKGDLIFTSSGKLVKHWIIEKTLCLCDFIKGAQVVKVTKDSPLTAVVVLKSNSVDRFQIKAELQAICKNNKLDIPEKFAFVTELPRINTKIQKYRLRQMIESNNLDLI